MCREDFNLVDEQDDVISLDCDVSAAGSVGVWSSGANAMGSSGGSGLSTLSGNKCVGEESVNETWHKSVIRFGSQNSNEQHWTESDLENYMKRCRKDWGDEEQESLMEALRTLHELKRSWKIKVQEEGVGLEAQVGDTDAERDVEKIEASGAMRWATDAAKCVGEAWEASMSGVRRVAEVEDEIDNDRTTTCLVGNLELEKVLEHKMLENSDRRVLAIGNEFDGEQTTKCLCGCSKKMRVWRGEEYFR